MQPDSRLRQLAQTSANFGFLLGDEPLLLSCGAAAESYVFDDPNASMVKARQFGEAVTDGLIVRASVVEVKREGTTLSAVSVQSSGYTDLTAEQRPRAWRTPLPLRYESNGAETWFANGLDPAPQRSRAVFSFHRPETVA